MKVLKVLFIVIVILLVVRVIGAWGMNRLITSNMERRVD